MRVEAEGRHLARGPWQAHRTFLGDWVIHWVDKREIEISPVLPDGAYMKGCSGESCERCGHGGC